MCMCRKLSSLPLLLVLVFASSLSQSVSQERQGFAGVENAKLYYTIVGTGEPIVIVHGGPGLDHTYLLPQMNALAGNNELVYYDQRASGQSSGTVDTASITPDQFVEDLEGLRKGLGIEKMNLLGHSWGGLLSMEYAIKYPQHMKSLVLVSSMGATSDCMDPFVKTRIERTTHEDSVSLAALQTSPGFSARDPETMSKYMRILFKTYFFDRRFADSLRMRFNQNTASNLFPIFGLMGKYFAKYDLYEQLAGIQCPTLIIQGDYDPFPAEFGRKIAQHIKNSRFLLIEHCGHFPYIERPQEFARDCLTFWNNLQ
jgi:proline iminopeptidase